MVLLYTLLLKQKKLPVLDIANFFLCTSAFTWVVKLKKNPAMSNTDRFFCLNSTVYFTYSYSQPVKNIKKVSDDYCTTIVWYGISDSK